MAQLLSIEDKHYDVVNSEVFADLVDSQIIELLIDYRAKDDQQF